METPQVSYIDSELELSSLESARFSWAGGDYRGRPLLGANLAERLLALEDEHEAYGLALYEAIFPAGSEMREGLREAIVAAEREKSRLRFRLHLVPDLPAWVHALYWELLADSERRLALARSPDTAFSRYLDVRRGVGKPADDRPRLLCVVSAPSDIKRYGMAEIHRSEILRCLQASVEPLADDVEVAFLEPPITLTRLRERLMENGGFQLLHFYGHGRNIGGGGALVLEDEEGRAHFVQEELLSEAFLGVRELRLVTLVACHGGAPSSDDPFSGLAGRLVQRGLPAVIAMRRAVRVGSAHLFTQCFYRHLAQTGRADAAVNEARQQLYLARPKTIDWSSPILYSRLADGRLWLPRAAPSEIAQPILSVKPRRRLLRRLRPLQWLTALLAPSLFLLGLWPATRTELHLTQISAQLIVEVDELFSRTQLAFSNFSTSIFISHDLSELTKHNVPPNLDYDHTVRSTSWRTSTFGPHEQNSLQNNRSQNSSHTIFNQYLDPAYTLDANLQQTSASLSSSSTSSLDTVKAELAEGSEQGPSFCDPGLGEDLRSPLAYRMRGDRCEGIYEQDAPIFPIEIRSFSGGSLFASNYAGDVQLYWTAPPDTHSDVRLRAFSRLPATHYRMDTVVPANRSDYHWSREVTASLGLNGDIGIVAWIDTPGIEGNRGPIYLPLRPDPTTKVSEYNVLLSTSLELSGILITTKRIDARGNDTAMLRQNEEPANHIYIPGFPINFSMGKLGAAGYYRLEIKGFPRSGPAIEQIIDLYYPGD